MKLTKILSIFILSLAMTFALLSCGGKDKGGQTSGDQTGDSGNDQTNDDQTGGSENENEEPVSYEVSWYDESGSLITTTTVNEGSVPSYTYTKNDTAEWDYTVAGWSATEGGEALSTLPECASNVSYYAVVSQVKQKYTVTFNSKGGSTVASQTVEYGSLATVPETPEYEGYKFLKWCTDAEGTNEVDFTKVITGNVEYFASWKEKNPIFAQLKDLLVSLLEEPAVTPYTFIPDTMKGNYSANLVDPNNIVDDYSDFVSVSSIECGFAEQWNMVLENMDQSEIFFKVLNVVDSISTSSVTSFNKYIDSNDSDTVNYRFTLGEYGIVIYFDGSILTYVVEYTASLPVLGQQTIQIALSTNLEGTEKAARVQIGDANAIAYVITEDSYDFAIKYAGVRRAMLSIKTDEDGVITGKIYEFLGVDSLQTSSAAEFVITDEYVSVVGNKADGMLGFTGYITELYDKANGKLVGYEVLEEISLLTYDTLWFNLGDVSGINSIKYVEKTDDTPAAFFVNGSSVAWSAMKYGGASFKVKSRRFDIEFRTQYVYSYDEATGEYVKHEISVPMIFVQEEKYSTFAEDVKTENGITIVHKISEADLNKILSDYDEMIPTFIENKDKITADDIVKYIGDKISFK